MADLWSSDRSVGEHLLLLIPAVKDGAGRRLEGQPVLLHGVGRFGGQRLPNEDDFLGAARLILALQQLHRAHNHH